MSSSINEKPKLVVLLSRFPYPLEKGDKLRAYYQIKELSNKHAVHLIALSDQKVNAESIEKLNEFCTSIQVIRLPKIGILLNVFLSFFSKKPFQIGYFYNYFGHLKIKKTLQKIKPNHIYCQLIRTTEYVKNYHDCPKTLDYMDALSKGIERRIGKSPWYLKWLFASEAKRLKEYERIIFDYFENKTIISEQDRDLISHPNKKSIVCIPNGIDAAFFEDMKIEKSYDLVFVGNLSYAPNIEAVEYISKHILHLLPNLTCLISGANPHASLKKLCQSNPQITLQGWVDDIRTVYAKGRVFVAPMMIGTGMQNKLLESMAAGTPCITSSLANNAINAIHNESILVANTLDEFKTGINRLLSDKELYNQISVTAKAFVMDNYSWKKTTDQLNALIEK